jgi:hypothetical protein
MNEEIFYWQNFESEQIFCCCLVACSTRQLRMPAARKTRIGMKGSLWTSLGCCVWRSSEKPNKTVGVPIGSVATVQIKINLSSKIENNMGLGFDKTPTEKRR